MSAGLQIQMTPPTPFTIQELDTLIIALETRVKAREILHRKEAAAELGISVRQLDEISSKGSIPFHRIEGLHGKIYLRSEIIEAIKKH